MPSLPAVQMRTVGKAFLILLPLAIVGFRLHARATSNPIDVTREVNRCLSMVRAAASRGREDGDRQCRERKPPQQDSPPAPGMNAASGLSPQTMDGSRSA